MTSKREQIESQQRNKQKIKNDDKKPNGKQNTGEARSRDNYVYPHRWSDGTKMAGIARKVGPNDSRFPFVDFYI